jgi:predicted AlkP superfamily phosphohydrolase/phosphomutase
LYLNLRGRDPEGVVESGEQAQHLLTEIKERLRHISDPSTGRPVQVRLYHKEKVYSGPFIREAPDLVVTMDDHRTEVMAELGFENLFNLNPVRSGTHTAEGILIAKGPGIPAGRQLGAGLMDVAPTVLHLSGVPVPDEADGQVLLDLFEENAEPRLRPVVTEPVELVGEEEMVYTEVELRQVEKQLRDLGYLE